MDLSVHAPATVKKATSRDQTFSSQRGGLFIACRIHELDLRDENK